MAWEWSHTHEAYIHARRQMEALDRETRETIAAEWLATPKDEFGGHGFSHLDLRKYHHSKARVGAWDDERLDGFIWERMEEMATCSNGGWEAWCCPHGCGPHLVPFSPLEETADVD